MLGRVILRSSPLWKIIFLFFFLLFTRWVVSENSLRSLVRFLILLNSWIKIVGAHFPWSNLYHCTLNIWLHLKGNSSVTDSEAYLENVDCIFPFLFCEPNLLWKIEEPSWVIRLNLVKCEPSVLDFGLMLPVCCFYTHLSYYFLIFFALTTFFDPLKRSSNAMT